ncbi:DUF551 domain-containing protein [Escherichia coli]|nr:DUF551 domain-containing protein [Escherichia coli]ELJ2031212.1 DUF551 domain-containing protein [Escherichia coli]HCP7481665.1 DUF551 domain-containing protein [Escherichia coli]
MTTFTDKELIKEIRERIGSLDVRDNIERRAYEIALASLEAKPIGAFHIAEQQVDGTSDYLKDGEWPIDNGIIEVYAAPPVPVVPEEKPMPNPLSMYAVDAVAAIAEVRGWNACRAAMLQSGNFRENKNSSTNNFREIPGTSTNYPVIPSEVLSAIQKVAKIRADFDDFDGDRRGIGDCLDEAEQELIVTINKYASQLAVKPVVPVGLDERAAFNAWNNDENLPIAGVGAKNAAWLAWQARAELGHSLVVNSPVTPDSWISCSERMPDDGQWCVVNTEYGYYVQCWSEGQGWLGDDISIPECDVINWMPLPEPPQEVK